MSDGRTDVTRSIQTSRATENSSVRRLSRYDFKGVTYYMLHGAKDSPASPTPSTKLRHERVGVAEVATDGIGRRTGRKPSDESTIDRWGMGRHANGGCWQQNYELQ